MNLEPGDKVHLLAEFVDDTSGGFCGFFKVGAWIISAPYADIRGFEPKSFVIGDHVVTSCGEAGEIVGICDGLAWLRLGNGSFMFESIKKLTRSIKSSVQNVKCGAA